MLTEHSAYDRELIALIKKRHIFDLNQLNLPAHLKLELTGGGSSDENGGVTIQSLIDDQDRQSYGDEEEDVGDECGDEEIENVGGELEEIGEEETQIEDDEEDQDVMIMNNNNESEQIDQPVASDQGYQENINNDEHYDNDNEEIDFTD